MPVYRLTEDLVFPPPSLAVEEGLLAVGGDLSSERLLLAYRMGIFPWYSEGDPILWWSPDPRLVLFPGELHISRRFRRTLKTGRFTITFDTAFDRVVEGCATVPRHGQDGTWILPEMAAAYCRLHEEGYGHSVECWRGDTLVGGLYGLSIGKCFFGESMFSRVADASKASLAALCEFALEHRFHFIDCQLTNEHLMRLGARTVPRKRFLKLLEAGVHYPTLVGAWSGLLTRRAG